MAATTRAIRIVGSNPPRSGPFVAGIGCEEGGVVATAMQHLGDELSAVSEGMPIPPPAQKFDWQSIADQSENAREKPLRR
jgi:hypothetical protein